MSSASRYAEALGSFKTSTVLQDLSLAGRVVVVTGGASGIGLALSQAVMEVGGSVAAMGAAKEPDVEFSNVFRSKVGSEVRYYTADIADEHALKAGFESIKRDFGRIDGIIACAGVCIEKPFLDSTWDDVQSLHNVNSLGTFFSIQHAVRAMLDNPATENDACRGSVVIVGSIATARKCEAQALAAYSASKGSSKGLLAGLSVELAPLGVRVNMISPGHTVTNMSISQFDTRPELEREMLEAVPMGRLGHRRDMKGAAVYLLSGAALYTTGTEIVISGGLHAGRV